MTLLVGQNGNPFTRLGHFELRSKYREHCSSLFKGYEVRFFCQDETRIGLKTISGRKTTAREVKPKAKVQ